MKIWCVDHAGLSWNIHSELFFTKEEARLVLTNIILKVMIAKCTKSKISGAGVAAT